MVIGIDVRVLGNQIKSGVEEYTQNLLANMLPLDGNIKFKLFYSAFRRKLPDFEWAHLPNVEVFSFGIPNQALFASARFFNRPKVDLMIGGADVFFSPHFFLAALTKKCKRVTTFHDLSFIHFPEFFSWRQNVWHHFEMVPKWQSKFSDKIIAVSTSTKNDLAEKYNLDPAKVEVIYSGILNTPKPTAEELEDFKKKRNLPDNFILFLGKLEPRKNIIGIIKAFNLLKSNGNFRDLNLVIGGSRGWLYKEIFREYSKSPFRENIIFTGHLNDNERTAYYSLASVFVYPSFFEGFGFPPLEAMACGTPVVVSNRSSLPEVVGDSGLLVNPYNIEEIAQATANLLTDPRLRGKMIQRGIKRSQNFTWQKAASQTLEVLVRA